MHELPDVAVEAAEFLLHPKECLGIRDGRSNLQLIADDARIAQELADFAPVVPRHPLGIESLEGPAIVFALVENRAPTQTGLRAFENQKLEERPVVVRRRAPFFIVIADHEFAGRPTAANRRLLARLGHYHLILDERVSSQRTLSSRLKARRNAVECFT